ncbi:structural protein [Paracoccus phage vB_PmaP_KLEP18-1]|nr:structural protein [Paracoccus phage vB_PmaP_KLEP18-1]
MLGRFFPQGGQGFGAALQDASPLLLAMAQGLQSGQGAFAQAPQGIAAMMQAANRRQGDQIFRDVMGGGVNTGQAMQAPSGAPTLSSVMRGGGTVPQTGTPQNVNPAIAGAFPQSLIRTESGGNWQALNNEMGAGGRGHGGRLQFGTGRLQDAARAGVIAGMTPQEFAQQPPEVQQQVEAWHFADIDRQAQSRGLDRYVGQTVGGVPITQDAIRAMAHLGGIGGAARFLESGGEYNPADANGTSLADYARIHGGTGQNAYGQTVQMEQPDPARLARLYEAFGNPNLSPEQRQAIGLRIQAEEQRTQPMTPLQQIELQRAQLELDRARQPEQRQPIEVGGVLLDPVTYQPIFDSRSQGGDNQTERDISLLGELGIPRDEAIRITQLNQVSRDPVTGETVIINRQTGQPVGVPAATAPVPAATGAPTTAAGTAAEGLQFPEADSAFGLGGAARRALNTAADVAGFGVPFPGQQETQSNFNVLREMLRTNIASGYGSRPSNYVLQQIDALLPSAGSPVQGAQGAQSSLEALERVMRTEREAVAQSLNRRLSPPAKQEIEAQLHSLDTSITQIGTALRAFSGRQDTPGAQTSSGVQWRIIE